jgi:hypothetical protein
MGFSGGAMPMIEVDFEPQFIGWVFRANLTAYSGRT